MLRFLIVSIALFVVGMSGNALGQTYDEIVAENQTLRQRVETLERQLKSVHHFVADEHSHGDDHDHDHEHGVMEDAHHHDHAASGKDHCEPHFDFCLPFEDHHGGHGYCDLCGYGDMHAGEGDEHGHGHAHGPAYHHSIDGYPILHSARTEFFFVERLGFAQGTVDLFSALERLREPR